MKKMAIGVAAFCKRVGVGRTKAYQLIGAGELQAVKIGRRTLITVESIEALIERSSIKGGE